MPGARIRRVFVRGLPSVKRREDTTGRSDAHDDLVEVRHCRKRWRAVVGILRAMAAATDPASCRVSNRPTHSAAHLDRRSCPPDATPTLWTTRELERDRFRSADGCVDRSVMIMAGNSRGTAALTDSLVFSRHSGPGRSFLCPMSGDFERRYTNAPMMRSTPSGSSRSRWRCSLNCAAASGSRSRGRCRRRP